MNAAVSTRNFIEERLEQRRRKSKALTWMLWLFMVSSGFLFVSMALNLLARKNEAVPFPEPFWASTVFLLLSELTIVLTNRSFRRDELDRGVFWLTLTIAFTGLFASGQVIGWAALFEGLWAAEFTEPGMASLFLFLSILHGLHLLGGLVFLGVLANDYRKGELHAKRRLRLQNAERYWHFLAAVWVLVLIAALL